MIIFCWSISLHIIIILVFQKYDPNFMEASLDEAYLDITEVCKERDLTSEEVSLMIKKKSYFTTFLSLSLPLTHTHTHTHFGNGLQTFFYFQ